MADRIQMISHRGKSIMFIDLRGCTVRDMMVLLSLVRSEVAQHPRNSLLILAEFAGAEIDHDVAMKIKEVLALDRPYVKRSAWVGTENLPKAFYDNFKSFSRREFPTFKTREEAMEWLVKE